MLSLDFSSFPTLSTERLLLRELRDEDVREIHKLRADDRVNKYIDRPNAQSIAETGEFIDKIKTLVQKNEGLYWAITQKGDDILIGTICFWNFDVKNDVAEIGYELRPEFQGKGIMREAIEVVIAYGFDAMHLKAITAFSSSNNLPSVALLEKLKFRIDDHFSIGYYSRGRVKNMVEYILRKEDH